MAPGIDVGDAIFRFDADTTGLDAGLRKVDNIPTNIDPAKRAVNDLGKEFHTAQNGARELGEETDLAGEKVKFSMYEAKGELGLLGEAIGVKLPRHVRSFVAELPGMGAALTAAFSATAVLFVLQAIVETTKKLTEFTIEALYNAKSQEEMETATKNLNGELVVLHKAFEEAKAKADAYGKSAMQLARESKESVQERIKDLTAEFKREEEELKVLDEAVRAHGRTRIGVMEAYHMARTGQLSYLEAITAVTLGETAAVLKGRELIETQNRLIKTAAELKLEHQNLRNSTNGVVTVQRHLNEEYKKAQEAFARTVSELAKDEEKLERALNKGVVAVEAQITELPKFVQQILKTGQAFRDMGVITVGTFEQQAAAAKKSYSTIYEAEQRGLATSRDLLNARMKLVQAEIALAKARGLSTMALDKEMKELKKMIGETDDYGKLAKKVADQVGHAVVQTAFAYGQGAITITQALRQVTGAIISEVAKQAEVEGAKNLAKAFGDMGDYDFGAAGHHFAAAGAWFALAGGASAVAGAVSGSSATPGTVGNPVNVTGTGATSTGGGAAAPKPMGSTSIQSFANAGLITKPTLAMLGDRPGSKGEVAFDLDDKRSIDAIKEAMGGGGGGDIHVHVKGMISGDNLGKVIQNISQRVKRGQSTLHSSNSQRVTKRSA